jgi:chemotaxis family two-component system response regulator Rcp1
MKINAEIIIIEDDEDDRLFLKDIFESLSYPNKIVYFEDSTLVMKYLLDSNVKPFMILSDVNMPKLDGYELRDLILQNETLKDKCLPYIFLSTSKNPEFIAKAYAHSAQGYFTKESNFNAYKELIQNIIEYWQKSLTPVVEI